MDNTSGTRPQAGANAVRDSVSDTSRAAAISAAVEHAVAAYRELTEMLRSDVEFLRRELETRTEELRRKDHIIAALAQQRALEIQAPGGHRTTETRRPESSHTPPPGPSSSPVPPGPNGSSAWWRRWWRWAAIILA